ncbi:MAG: hypothetical protein CMI31_12220 [Opitutae bacterium]|nr:hypothetical protein [Opitutae bacterium]
MFEERVDCFRCRFQIVFHEQAFGLLIQLILFSYFFQSQGNTTDVFFVIQIWFGCLLVFMVEPLAVTGSLQQDEKG